MSFRLLKTSALSGVPNLYSIDGRDYAHITVGVGEGTTAALSSVKATFDQIHESVYSNKTANIYSVGWLSAGAGTARKMLSRGGCVVLMDGGVDAAHGALSAAQAERLTVQGNISASGGLSASGGGYNYFANRIGIGTTTPARELDVSGTGNVYIRATVTTDNDSAALELVNTQETWSIVNDDTNADALEFQSDGGTKMTIEPGGNIGIGDTDPGTLLQLAGGDAYLTLQNTTDENNDGGAETKIIFEDHSNTALAQIQASHEGTSNDTKGELIMSTHSGSSLTERVRIDSSGNVGIGTTSPEQKLHMDSGDILLSDNSTSTDSGRTIYWHSTTSNPNAAAAHAMIKGGRVDASNGYLAFNCRRDAATTELMRVDGNTGNVGINDTTPAEKLDVDGNIRTTGNLIISDGGSITEGGGTAAFTFDGTANVTKIGQSSTTTDHFLKWDGSKAVWSNDSTVVFNALQFNSDIATAAGAPIVCDSTALCSNLNADLWDGYQFADYLNQGVKTTSSPSFARVHVNDPGSADNHYILLGGDNNQGIRTDGNGCIQVHHSASAEDDSLYDAGTGRIGWGTVLNAGFAALCYGKVNLTGSASDRGIAAAGCKIARSGVGQFEVTPDRKTSSHTCVFAQGDYRFSSDIRSFHGVTVKNFIHAQPANTNTDKFKIAAVHQTWRYDYVEDDGRAAWPNGYTLLDTGVYIQFVAFDPVINVKSGKNGSDEPSGGRFRCSINHGVLPDGTSSDEGFDGN